MKLRNTSSLVLALGIVTGTLGSQGARAEGAFQAVVGLYASATPYQTSAAACEVGVLELATKYVTAYPKLCAKLINNECMYGEPAGDVCEIRGRAGSGFVSCGDDALVLNGEGPFSNWSETRTCVPHQYYVVADGTEPAPEFS